MNLQEVAQRLKTELNDPNILCIGIAEKGQYNPEDHLILYLKRSVRYPYPEKYENIHVFTRIMRGIELC